jgi:hypothetical protein
MVMVVLVFKVKVTNHLEHEQQQVTIMEFAIAQVGCIAIHMDFTIRVVWAIEAFINAKVVVVHTFVATAFKLVVKRQLAFELNLIFQYL